MFIVMQTKRILKHETINVNINEMGYRKVQATVVGISYHEEGAN